MPRLRHLDAAHNGFGDAGVQAMCEGLVSGATPSLLFLVLRGNRIAPAGADAFASALCRGAMPKLEVLLLCFNPLGKQGVAALAAPLRKLPALKELYLSNCAMGDEGVASLVKDLEKDDFNALTNLILDNNMLTDTGYATIAAALGRGAMPKLEVLRLRGNDAASAAARRAVGDAAKARDIVEY